MTNEAKLIWQPSEQQCEQARVTAFVHWLREEKGLDFECYEELWQWSVDEQASFWEAVTQYYNVEFYRPYSTVLGSSVMPGAQWFPGSELNFVEHLLLSLIHI